MAKKDQSPARSVRIGGIYGHARSYGGISSRLVGSTIRSRVPHGQSTNFSHSSRGWMLMVKRRSVMATSSVVQPTLKTCAQRFMHRDLSLFPSLYISLHELLCCCCCWKKIYFGTHARFPRYPRRDSTRDSHFRIIVCVPHGSPTYVHPLFSTCISDYEIWEYVRMCGRCTCHRA